MQSSWIPGEGQDGWLATGLTVLYWTEPAETSAAEGRRGCARDQMPPCGIFTGLETKQCWQAGTPPADDAPAPSMTARR